MLAVVTAPLASANTGAMPGAGAGAPAVAASFRASFSARSARFLAFFATPSAWRALVRDALAIWFASNRRGSLPPETPARAGTATATIATRARPASIQRRFIRTNPLRVA